MRIEATPFSLCIVVALILFGVAAYLDFTDGAHAVGWACVASGVFVLGWLFFPRRVP